MQRAIAAAEKEVQDTKDAVQRALARRQSFERLAAKPTGNGDAYTPPGSRAASTPPASPQVQRRQMGEKRGLASLGHHAEEPSLGKLMPPNKVAPAKQRTGLVLHH